MTTNIVIKRLYAHKIPAPKHRQILLSAVKLLYKILCHIFGFSLSKNLFSGGQKRAQNTTGNKCCMLFHNLSRTHNNLFMSCVKGLVQ